MTSTSQENSIDYVEFPATDLEATKKFYTVVFGWEFKDYGSEYASFHHGSTRGGFAVTPTVSPGGPLVVLYSKDLGKTSAKISESGGRIVKDIFEFPGGRRFHFADPSGNELAVWSER